MGGRLPRVKTALTPVQAPNAVGEPPLAEAKLAAPRERSGIVERPRVERALDAGTSTALTLVAAPPGYGKTTAVRAWCARRDAAFAWVTLDAGDNDPVRLWAYVATAVDRVRPGLGREALRRLRIAGAPIEGPVDELLNGIAAFGEELVVVLDDLQTVTAPDCLASIEYALEHLPANGHLIAIARTDPALRLARLRARGELAEVRAGDLAFTAAEAHEFLVDRGRLELEAQEVETLRRRTEGWPAALFLALLWLRGVEDAHEAVREFGGDHRFVAEYLSSEVIRSLEDDACSFLIRASVLGRLTPELCDAVLGRSDSASMLARLERSNLLVVGLAHGGWYRVHALFAEFAEFELASREPDAVPELHRRAASWFRSHGMPVEATHHAAAAGDDELVADLLVESHLALIQGGRAQTLLHWARRLPDDRIVARPELAVAAATAARIVGHSTLEQRRLLELAGRSRTAHPDRFTPYVEAVAGMVRAASLEGGVRQAVRDGRRAVELAEAGEDAVLVAARGAYARALYFAGELDDAWEVALEAVEHPDADHRLPGHAFARSTLALVALDRGHLASARTHAEKAKALLGHVGAGRSWLGANASAGLGAVLAEEGSLADAERELAHAEHFFQDEVATVHDAWLLTLLARVRSRRGRLDEARTTLRLAAEAVSELGDSGRIAALLSDVERELAEARLRAGNGEVLERPSEAELAVLRLLASDLSIREIGGKLFLSPNTVRSHTRAIYRKLAVNSRADAVARAEALGLLGTAESPM